VTVSIETLGEVALVTVDNPPVNALSQAVRAGLSEAVDTLDADPQIRAAVLICVGRTFMAGADVREFGKTPQPPALSDVVNRIEAATKPWIAAIHGTALGGGLEVALGCHYRVAVPSAKVGLPEVTLGIIPGAGGTVRLPRVADLEHAIEMITIGRPIGAETAHAYGILDAVVEGDLKEDTIAFARERLRDALPLPVSKRPVPQVSEEGFWEKHAARIAKHARGQASPLRALEAVRNAVELDAETALAKEREIFVALRDSDQSAALRHVFFAERAAAKLRELEGIVPREIKSAAVIGGGTMGAGIAAALLDADLPVVLVEQDEAGLERGLANVRQIYDSAVKRGRLSAEKREAKLSMLAPSLHYAALSDADLVIEAVFEDLDVKRSVFVALDSVVKPDAILATNTSYLDPNAIATPLSRAENFLGLHFFSPANIMKLLEIVKAEATSPEVLKTGFALAKRLGKTAVLAGICDGFIGNRIYKTYRRQAEQLLLDGCQPGDVDRAMRGFGLPMGPFEVQDLSGLDIAEFQRKAARARGETVLAPIADRLCGLKRYGQKTGGGWYDYEAGNRMPIPSETVAAIIAEETEQAGRTAKSLDDEIVQQRLVFPMINEAARILEEGIARRSLDIDLVEIHGYGFPRWRGGLLFYADQYGLEKILPALEAMAAEGTANAPCPFLKDASAKGGFSNLTTGD